MIAFLRKLRKDRRGNALVIAGALLPLIVGAAGLATDTIEWTLWKRQLQRAADSAAIAGVYDREAADGATSTVENAVDHDLSINLHTIMELVGGYPQVDTSIADTTIEKNHVKVTLAVQQSLPFSSLFLSAAPTITATATAASIESGGTACVQALENSASATGITNSGNTTVNMPNCVMYSNSPSANSASAGGSSDVTARAIAAVGGIAHSNNWHVSSYLPYSPQLPDPFAGIAPDPNEMKCAGHYVAGHGSNPATWVYDALTASTNMTTAHWLDSAGVEHTGGANCWTSLSVGSSASMTVPANFGPIYINGGNVNFQGDFSCSGCSIVLTNKNTATTATIGTVSANAQAHNVITAPTSGTFAGIAIYQDRRATGNTDHVNGGSASAITGALYFPKDILWINGSGADVSLCAMFVARRITFTGNSGIALHGLEDEDCAGVGMPSVSSVKMVRLVA